MKSIWAEYLGTFAAATTTKKTLYMHPLSQPSQTVRTILDIAGVEYETKIIDLTTGEQNSQEYIAINPFH
jgi:glutathione S-transferase